MSRPSGEAAQAAEPAPPVVRGAFGVPGSRHAISDAAPVDAAGDPDAETASAWVMRAQDGEAEAVLTETAEVLRGGALSPRARARVLYARTLALFMAGHQADAVTAARELVTVCRREGLTAFALQAQAVLVDLLRREGAIAEAAEQLALAVALEPALRDLSDPEVQTALGALGLALRSFGVADEATRVEGRLQEVEATLPRHHRVGLLSNRAMEHAIRAMSRARTQGGTADEALLDLAVAEIEGAVGLAEGDSYSVVDDEAGVLRALREATVGAPDRALALLESSRGVRSRGAEAVTAQLLWASGRVRALRRLQRFAPAAEEGRRLLREIPGSGAAGDRLVLAYEVLFAELEAGAGDGEGAREFVALSEARVDDDSALLQALFRARVDILRGAAERRMLAEAAALDPLTGLVNRRAAAAAVDSAADAATGRPYALLLLDLDGFKQINDSRGHLVGDEALQRVADALRTAARTDDIVARWGGDEFVVVAALDRDEARVLADRLRDTVRAAGSVPGSGRLTVSAGVAVRSAPVDPDAWLRRADAAMYVAKRAGGDATVVD